MKTRIRTLSAVAAGCLLATSALAQVPDELMRHVARAENFSPVPFMNSPATSPTLPVTVCLGEVVSGTAIFVADQKGVIHKIRVENRIGNCAFRSDATGRAILKQCPQGSCEVRALLSGDGYIKKVLSAAPSECVAQLSGNC